MCPPRAGDVIDEIGPFWTDEALFVFIESIQSRSPSVPLPSDVFDDINPYLYEPSNLPENIWYLVKSDCRKQSEFGFWRVKDDSRPIYSGASVTGWRTILEFYNDCSPNGDQTNWLMHEYSISLEGLSDVEGKRSLCRIFPSDKKGENPKMDQNPVHSDVIARNNSSHDEDDKRKQVDIYQENGDAGGRNDAPHDENNEGSESDIGIQLERLLEGGDLGDVEHLLNDDYFELADLLDPLSSPSSSETSSCLSICSDGLPNKWEAELEQLFPLNPSSSHTSISRALEAVFPLDQGISDATFEAAFPPAPAPEGTSTGNAATNAAEPAEAETRAAEVPSHEKRQYEGDDPSENAKKRSPPTYDDAEASSSRQSPRGDNDDDGKKGGMTIKKFFCFLAF